MTRRTFVATTGAGALALGIGAVPLLAPGAEVQRGGGVVGPPLGPEEERILSTAALAASNHNTQPWAVLVEVRDHLTVSADLARKLRAVDPDGRELALSLGAFLGNLSQAASATGREATIEAVAAPRGQPPAL